MADYFKRNKKAALILTLCLCVVSCAVGGVFAYLSTLSGTVSNELTPASVTCAVEESFANGVKENVRVRNTGNIDAYIRAAVVVSFVADDGKVLATAPREGTDYKVSWNTADWQKGSDGYWYHKKAVAPEALTATLIKTATAVSVPDGYRLNVQIVAAAIQSAPESTVKEVWNVTLSGGELIPD